MTPRDANARIHRYLMSNQVAVARSPTISVGLVCANVCGNERNDCPFALFFGVMVTWTILCYRVHLSSHKQHHWRWASGVWTALTRLTDDVSLP